MTPKTFAALSALALLAPLPAVAQQQQAAPPPPAAALVATGPGEAPGEVFVEHLAPEQAAPAGSDQSLTAPVGASEQPAQARTSGPDESDQSRRVGDDLPVEHAFDATPGEPAQALPAEPIGVAGSPVPSAAPVSEADPLSVAEPETPSVPAPPVEDPIGTSLPDDFGRPEQPQRLEYTAPAFDAAPGSTGVTRSSGPGGTGVQTGAPQNRNDDCACGSGRKYKRCHGDPRRTA